MPKTSVTCDGKTFASVSELCAHYGKSPQVVTQRLRTLGWTPEQAVELIPRKRRGTTGKPVEVDGVRYESIVDACAAHGLKAATVTARLARGYKIDESFSVAAPKRKPAAGKPSEVDGKRYRSHEEMARAYGQKWGNVRRRLDRGWSMKQALQLEPPPPRFRAFEGHARDTKWKEARITEGVLEPVPNAGGYKLYLVTNIINGKAYVGITIGSLEQRLKQHFSAVRRGRKSAFCNAVRKYGEGAFRIELLSDAAGSFSELQELEVREIQLRDSIRNGYNTAAGGSLGTSKQIAVAGRVFPSYAQAADHFGIDPSVFALRVNRLGWSPEEAAGLLERTWVGKKKPVAVNGLEYESLWEAAHAHGVDYKLAHARVTKGWTVEQALQLTSLPSTVRFTGRMITAFGVQYGSLAKAALGLGINPQSFRKRLQEGATAEEAFHRARKKV